jgi:hypothetical protein
MMKGESSNKLRPIPHDHGFTDTLLSWSLEQIENQDLFKDQVCLALIKHSLSFFF